MRPTVGRIVHCRPQGAVGDSLPSAAIITMVWSGGDSDEAPQCVNLTVFPSGQPPQYYSNMMLHPKDPKVPNAAWWPPHV